MVALQTASGIWGGEGFIVAAYGPDGTLSDPVTDLVIEYDPDHVIVMKPSIADVARIEGRELASFLSDPTQFSNDMSESLAEQDHLDRAAKKAAELLSKSCTLMETTDGATSHPLLVGVSFVRPGGGSGSLIEIKPPASPTLAANVRWSGPVNLWLAATVGVATPEDTASDVRVPPDDQAALRWLFRRDSPVPDALLRQRGLGTGILADNQPTWFGSPDPTLTTIGRGRGTTFGALVIGDTAEDFCLAVAYKRMLNTAVWLTTDTLVRAGVRALYELSTSIAEPARAGQSTCLVSASLTDLEIVSALRGLDPGLIPDPVATDRTWRGEPTSFTKPPLDQVRFGLVLGNMVDEAATVPARVSDDGTITLAAPLTLPIPNQLWDSGRGREHPYWYVDVDVDGALTPPAHGLRARHLLAQDDRGNSVQMIRSSRQGISLLAVRQGFVDGRAIMISRMVRPRLQLPAMASWIAAKAEDSAIGVKHSTPGLHANLIAQRLGGRDRFMGLSGHPAFGALGQFATLEQHVRSDKVFPEHDGVVLERTPFVTAVGMRRAAGNGSDAVPMLIDRLASASLIRRGLVLGCEECDRPSFISVDELAHVYGCPQCGHRNELTAKRWRTGDEPVWFYDLHARFREWFASNGLVPLLAARELKARAHLYGDVTEVEFSDRGSKERFAEIDLVARMDGHVVIAEAKKAGSLGETAERPKAIGKLLRVAALLHADRLYLATTRASWPETELDEVRHAATTRDDLRHLSVEALLVS